MFALPGTVRDVRFGSKADIGSTCQDVRFVPKADISRDSLDHLVGAGE
jgi:hypothetical protein